MQYTIRNIPPRLDRAIREQAKREGKSLNETTIEALLRAFGLSGERVRHRDVSDLVGTWVEEPEVEEALRDQRQIDESIWR